MLAHGAGREAADERVDKRSPASQVSRSAGGLL